MYKVTIENLTDKTDKFEMDCEAAIIFMGKIDIKEARVLTGFGFAGHMKILEDVIGSIPYHISEFRKAQVSGVVTPGAKDKKVLSN